MYLREGTLTVVPSVLDLWTLSNNMGARERVENVEEKPVQTLTANLRKGGEV